MTQWIITKNHVTKLPSISKVFIHTSLTNTLYDALIMKFPTLEIWKPSKEIQKKKKIVKF